MAQIWLTYEEMGTFTHRSPDEARADAIAAGWSRRRCSDGLTRIKMPSAAAHRYMLHYADVAQAEADPLEDLAAADLAATENAVHRMQRELSGVGRELVQRRIPREREWVEPALARDLETSEPKWALAVKRMFG